MRWRAYGDMLMFEVGSKAHRQPPALALHDGVVQVEVVVNLQRDQEWSAILIVNVRGATMVSITSQAECIHTAVWRPAQ